MCSRVRFRKRAPIGPESRKNPRPARTSLTRPKRLTEPLWYPLPVSLSKRKKSVAKKRPPVHHPSRLKRKWKDFPNRNAFTQDIQIKVELNETVAHSQQEQNYRNSDPIIRHSKSLKYKRNPHSKFSIFIAPLGLHHKRAMGVEPNSAKTPDKQKQE